MSELRQERDRLPRTIIYVIIVSGVFAIAVGTFVAYAITRGGPFPQPAAELLGDRREVNEIELHDFDDRSAAMDQWDNDGQRLSSYGWVDRNRGVVHLPIDRAIEVYLSQRPGTGGSTQRTAESPADAEPAPQPQPQQEEPQP